MEEKYPGYASRNSFLKFVWCVAAEQNNNNNENSHSSHFCWYILIEGMKSLRYEAESSGGKKKVSKCVNLSSQTLAVGRKWKWLSIEGEHQQHGKFSLGYEKNFSITMIALFFVILKHSLQWRGEAICI